MSFGASLTYVNKRKGRGKEVKERKYIFVLLHVVIVEKGKKKYSLLDDENKTFENLFISISAL